jgi:Histidine kinase/Histidine kinase-, DNA gyrase B-, and HSP90-like ATPase
MQAIQPTQRLIICRENALHRLATVRCMVTSGPSSPVSTPAMRWAERFAPLVRAFHRYATWLVGISWRKFIVLAVLLLIGAGMLSELPPFTWKVQQHIETRPTRVLKAPANPTSPTTPTPPNTTAAGKEPIVKIETPHGKEDGEVRIVISGHEIVRVSPQKAADAAASAVQAAEAAASAAARAAAQAASDAGREMRITLPSNVDSGQLREAIEAQRQQAREAAEQAQEQAHRATELAEQAREAADNARDAVSDAVSEAVNKAVERYTEPSTEQRITYTRLGDGLPELVFFWILASAVIKATYKRQLQAQAAVAQATEVAESEQLKRQVVEARMAAMQAQVEPHFLFNTLASIDHLIETDPARASQMQKNLIALLRASMPTLREANHGAPRDLGREMAVVRPYLEILKVRMEERLITRIDVPEGLLSAEFPSMMIQSLVENAIKHGLEPKAEGGELAVRAEIVHGKLAVTVADTGLGFGRAATAGTGVGLANIRERLQLLYGAAATLAVNENQPSGTKVTVTVPYKSISEHHNTGGAV